MSDRRVPRVFFRVVLETREIVSLAKDFGMIYDVSRLEFRDSISGLRGVIERILSFFFFLMR